MNEILNLWLALAGAIVIVVGGFKIVKFYYYHKLNMDIINSYHLIILYRKQDIVRFREILDRAEGLANPRYINHARFLLDLREGVLNGKEKTSD